MRFPSPPHQVRFDRPLLQSLITNELLHWKSAATKSTHEAMKVRECRRRRIKRIGKGKSGIQEQLQHTLILCANYCVFVLISPVRVEVQGTKEKRKLPLIITKMVVQR